MKEFFWIYEFLKFKRFYLGFYKFRIKLIHAKRNCLLIIYIPSLLKVYPHEIFKCKVHLHFFCTPFFSSIIQADHLEAKVELADKMNKVQK